MTLVARWKEDGLEQRILHEQLGVTSPTLTGVIDGLVRSGYVERRPYPEDGRVRQPRGPSQCGARVAAARAGR